ncbi:MAG: hypothetical protein ABI641_13985 [Caldimonas sp.]
MTMAVAAPAWNEIWRVLAYTLAIALAFVALARLERVLFSTFATEERLQRAGLIDRDEPSLARDAAAIDAASRDALQRLPPGHRLAAVRLGYELGFANEFTGSYAMSASAVRARAEIVARPHLAIARAQGALLGLQAIEPLPVRTLQEFTDLGRRYEDDENGLAGVVGRSVSPQHRELFLLGAQLGLESARIEGSAGEHTLPSARLIRRHATLAGIAPALWRPLSEEPHPGETPAQVLARYRAGLLALGNALAGPDPASPAASR